MKLKSEVFKHFQKFKNKVEKAIGRHVQCLRSDGGKEYFLDAFTTYLRQEGIRREFVGDTHIKKMELPNVKFVIYWRWLEQ